MSEAGTFPVRRPGDSAVRGFTAGSRDLSEDIFPSAEEAVLAERAHAASDFQPHEQTPRPAATESSGRQASLMRSIRAQVAEYPCRSALMAAAVGALAMLLLRSQVRRRMGSRSLPR